MPAVGGVEEDDFEFVNECVGTNVPSEFIPSVEKGCRDAIAKGDLVGFPVEGLRVVLQDGAAHAVDSSDQAFRAAALYAVKKAIGEAGAKVLEPVMALEVSAPTEFQGDIMGSIGDVRVIPRMHLGQNGEGLFVLMLRLPINTPSTKGVA